MEERVKRRRKRNVINYKDLENEYLSDVFLRGLMNNNHHDDSQEEGISGCTIKKLRTSTHPHVATLLSRDYKTSSAIKVLTNGRLLTAASLRASPEGLDKPILITDHHRSLGMVMPSKLSVRDVSNILGAAYPLSVMEVATQEESNQSWTLGDLAEYFDALNEQSSSSSLPILNQLSLEFTDTALHNKAKSPKFVRDIDWIENFWPKDRREKNDYPRVQHYCLTSARESFTDFHIDFGGTSVWYHIIEGQKTFLFVPPTDSNLKAYEDWLCSDKQATQFFGDLADACYRVDAQAGNTLIIPSGWIHAVYTPVDSVVFGGNFLHSLDIPRQIDIYCIEARARVKPKYQFPFFKPMMYYAAASLLQVLRYEQQSSSSTAEEKKVAVPPFSNIARLSGRERAGLVKLTDALKAWNVQEPSKLLDDPNIFASVDAARRVGHATPSDMVGEIVQRLMMSSGGGSISTNCVSTTTSTSIVDNVCCMLPTSSVIQDKKVTTIQTSRPMDLNNSPYMNDAEDEEDESPELKIHVPRNIFVKATITTDAQSNTDNNEDEWVPAKQRKSKVVKRASSSLTNHRSMNNGNSNKANKSSNNAGDGGVRSRLKSKLKF